jgi:hypothetical protein
MDALKHWFLDFLAVPTLGIRQNGRQGAYRKLRWPQ